MEDIDIAQISFVINDLLQNPKAEDRERMLIDLCVPLTPDQKMDVLKYYKNNFSEEGIVADIRKAFDNSRFGNTLAGLFIPRPDFICYEIHKRLDYYISDKDYIFEVLAGGPNWLIQCVKARYPTLFGHTLEEDLSKVYRGDIKRNAISLLNIERSENRITDEEEMERCANILAKNAPTAWSSNEEIFNEIFAQKSPEELLTIGRKYYQKTGLTLSQEVEKKLTGRNKVFMKELLYGVINPAEYMADKLRNEMKNVGVDTSNLDRIMISRYDVDMPLIRIFYLQKYGVKFYEDLDNTDVVGSYKDLLIALSQEMSYEQALKILEDNANA